MNKLSQTIKLFWQRLKQSTSRLFGVLKIVLVSTFLALVLIVTNYTELKDVVLSLLDEDAVLVVKDAVNYLYGSTSVLFALQQTAYIMVIPAMAILLRSICNFSFVKYIILLIRCGVTKVRRTAKIVNQKIKSQGEVSTLVSSKYLTLCRYIS